MMVEGTLPIAHSGARSFRQWQLPAVVRETSATAGSCRERFLLVRPKVLKTTYSSTRPNCISPFRPRFHVSTVRFLDGCPLDRWPGKGPAPD